MINQSTSIKRLKYLQPEVSFILDTHLKLTSLSLYYTLPCFGASSLDWVSCNPWKLRRQNIAVITIGYGARYCLLWENYFKVKPFDFWISIEYCLTLSAQGNISWMDPEGFLPRSVSLSLLHCSPLHWEASKHISWVSKLNFKIQLYLLKPTWCSSLENYFQILFELFDELSIS